MIETEVKILDINRKELIKKLESMGAKKVFEGNMYFSFFDFDDSSLKSRKIKLRLRKEGSKTFITLKRDTKKSKAKIAKETETEVKDYAKIKAILLALGLKESKIMTKKRISFAIKDVKFDIDKYPGIPAFMEIESENIGSVMKYAKKLGFSPEDAKPWSMNDLFDYYKKN